MNIIRKLAVAVVALAPFSARANTLQAFIESIATPPKEDAGWKTSMDVSAMPAIGSGVAEGGGVSVIEDSNYGAAFTAERNLGKATLKLTPSASYAPEYFDTDVPNSALAFQVGLQGNSALGEALGELCQTGGATSLPKCEPDFSKVKATNEWVPYARYVINRGFNGLFAEGAYTSHRTSLGFTFRNIVHAMCDRPLVAFAGRSCTNSGGRLGLSLNAEVAYSASEDSRYRFLQPAFTAAGTAPLGKAVLRASATYAANLYSDVRVGDEKRRNGKLTLQGLVDVTPLFPLLPKSLSVQFGGKFVRVWSNDPGQRTIQGYFLPIALNWSI